MGVLDEVRSLFRRSKPQKQNDEQVRLADFGLVTNGRQSELVEFAAPGAITPEEAERLKTNQTGIGHLTLTLDGYIEEGRDEQLDKEDDEWLYEFWKMQQDDTVRDALNYVLGILHTTPYYVEPASEEEQDLDIAAFVADSLGLDGKRAGKYPFQRLLKTYEHALLYRRSAGELVFTIGEDNLVLLDKITPIHPFNIPEIEFDRRGGPRNIVVRGSQNNEDKDYVDKKVPIWKTVLFVNDDDGDFRGHSILEGAWLNWKIKRAMLQLINAGFERFLLGIPILKLPKGVVKGSQEWKDARNTLTAFAMKPRTGMLVPDGYEFEIQVVNSQMPDALPYLRLMDEGIYRAMGTSFSTLGKGENRSGTYTVGEELSATAARNVERIVKQFLDYTNTYVIPKLVMVNWPEALNYPTLKAGKRTEGEVSAILNAYGQMISAATGAEGFNPQLYQQLLEYAPSRVRDVLGYDADRRRALVETRRRSVR